MKIFSYRLHQKLNSPNKKDIIFSFIKFFKIIEILKNAEKGNVKRKEIRKKRLLISISMKSVPTCPVGGMRSVP